MLAVLSLLVPPEASLLVDLLFDDLLLLDLFLWLCFDDFVELVDASLVASVLAGAAAGAAAGADGAGAGVCAAAVSDTAKAPASSADINLVIFPSSVK